MMAGGDGHSLKPVPDEAIFGGKPQAIRCFWAGAGGLGWETWWMVQDVGGSGWAEEVPFLAIQGGLEGDVEAFRPGEAAPGENGRCFGMALGKEKIKIGARLGLWRP